MVPQAKKLIEKWSRLIDKVPSTYDEHGDFHEEYRNLKHRLEELGPQNDEDKEDEEGSASSGEDDDHHS